MICREIDTDTTAVLKGSGAGGAACAVITQITGVTGFTFVVGTVFVI